MKFHARTALLDFNQSQMKSARQVTQPVCLNFSGSLHIGMDDAPVFLHESPAAKRITNRRERDFRSGVIVYRMVRVCDCNNNERLTATMQVESMEMTCAPHMVANKLRLLRAEMRKMFAAHEAGEPVS